MNKFVSGKSRGLSLFSLALIGCLVFQTGCATIFRGGTIFQGRTQTIHVTSDPPGAEVFVNGKQVSSTPANIIVKRKSTVILRLEKEGYDPFEVKMKRRLSGWILADLLWVLAGDAMIRVSDGTDGSVRLVNAVIYAGIFLGIDFLTGSAYKQRSAKIEVRLSALKDKEVTP